MRNYEVGTILVRHEMGKGYRLLLVEQIIERTGTGKVSVKWMHESGYREWHTIRDIPIERALFSYRVVTEDEILAGVVELPRGESISV